MKELRLNYPVQLLKRVLSVSAGGYYDWLDIHQGTASAQ